MQIGFICELCSSVGLSCVSGLSSASGQLLVPRAAILPTGSAEHSQLLVPLPEMDSSLKFASCLRIMKVCSTGCSRVVSRGWAGGASE